MILEKYLGFKSIVFGEGYLNLLLMVGIREVIQGQYC